MSKPGSEDKNWLNKMASSLWNKFCFYAVFAFLITPQLFSGVSQNASGVYVCSTSFDKEKYDNQQITQSTVILNQGWNWRSFPRLQRSGNEPDLTASVLSRIDIFPVEVYIEHLTDPPQGIIDLEYDLFFGWDDGWLTEVQST